MRVAVSSDERTGVASALVDALTARGHAVTAHGALAAGDRPDWAWSAESAAREVAGGDADQAVVCCWTGTGASIAANKVPGIRAALCVDAQTAQGARRWNDANVLALSLRTTSEATLGEILDAWFAGARSSDPDDVANIAHVDEYPLSADIVIDARAAARPELGGVERWARELSARLPALAPGAYAVARPPAAFSHRLGHAWEQLVLPVQARRARWLLCPANLAPLAHPRTAVVLHDAAPLRNADWYSGTYARAQRALLPRIARHAKLVITVSEFSRAELRELLGVDAHVVPGGVDARFTPRADREAAAVALQLDRPYVLTVASRTTRKNLDVLSPVARDLAADGIEIVAAGGDRPQFRAQDHDGVRALGHVDDALLPGLYAGAQAFVLPSLYEGFGLTCLEAMACGTPVVAGDRAALPQTIGEAGLLVDPTDPAAITQQLRRAIDETSRLRAAGLAHAAPFTWDATARAVDALLRGSDG